MAVERIAHRSTKARLPLQILVSVSVGREAHDATRNITCYPLIDECAKTLNAHTMKLARQHRSDDASRVPLASQDTRNAQRSSKCFEFGTTQKQRGSNAYASLKQHAFDRASRFIDTRFDRLATRDLHTLMNKVLYVGRNAIRKQDFS